ncbi:MAG: Hsp20/alpha crystallin family protein, partial [Phycisphaerae bacterium]
MMTGRLNLWAPYQDLRRQIDQLFDAFAGFNGGPRVPAYPPVNIWEEGDTLYLEAELPGVKQEDLEISAIGRELTLRGRRAGREGQDVCYHRQERGVGEFTRVLTLPVEVESEQIEAALKDGVLTLTMPKVEAAKARKIKV